MLIDIQGFCPACGQETLHIERYVGMLHCLGPGCTDRGAAHALLSKRPEAADK